MDIMKYNVLIMYQHVLKKQIKQYHHMQIMEHNVDYIINIMNVNKIVNMNVFIMKVQKEIPCQKLYLFLVFINIH